MTYVELGIFHQFLLIPQFRLLFCIWGRALDEGDHIILDIFGHLHRLFRLGADQPLEDDEYLFEGILSNDQFADIICELVHGATVEDICVADLLEDADELWNYGVLLIHVGDEMVVLYFDVRVQLLSRLHGGRLYYRQVGKGDRSGFEEIEEEQWKGHQVEDQGVDPSCLLC